MDMQGVSIYNISSVDVRGVSLSTACSVDVQDVSSNVSNVDEQDVFI
jgi:hypothetical protein